MDKKESTNTAYIPNSYTYESNGYIGYYEQGNPDGCRRLFFVITGVVIMAIIGCILAIVL